MNRKDIAWGINLVAWGYLFLYLNLNLLSIDVLPNWLAYIFMVKAIGGLSGERPSLKLLRPLGILLGLWSAVVWGLSALGMSMEHYLLHVLQLIAAVLEIYFHFQLLTDLAELAGRAELPHRGKILRLRTVRTVLATVTALPILWTGNLYLVMALAIVGVVVGIWICAVLFGLEKALKQGPSLVEP